jgi:predicted acylesterase/phospholipase RssA
MRKGKITLILGPGGLPGASFEIGGLLALEDITGSEIIDLVDEFQGSSCGAIISCFLIAKQDVRSLYSTLYPDNPYYFTLSDLYDLNLNELLLSTASIPYYLGKMIKHLALNRNIRLYEKLTVPIQEMHLSGLFLTDGIQEYIERISSKFAIPRLYGDFCKKYGKNLYLLTTDLSSGEPLILDPVHFAKVEIKKAIAASAAVAPLFKPVEIGNGTGRKHKLADGAYAMSLGIRHAYERGADVIIYFNPLKPTTVASNVNNVFDIFEQIYRIPAHTRKQVSERDHELKHPSTLIGFEPNTDAMFHNLFRPDLRLDYADHGYISTLRKIHDRYPYAKALFAKADVQLIPKRRLGHLIEDFIPGKSLKRKRWVVPKQPSLISNVLGQSYTCVESMLSTLSKMINF